MNASKQQLLEKVIILENCEQEIQYELGFEGYKVIPTFIGECTGFGDNENIRTMTYYLSSKFFFRLEEIFALLYNDGIVEDREFKLKRFELIPATFIKTQKGKGIFISDLDNCQIRCCNRLFNNISLKYPNIRDNRL